MEYFAASIGIFLYIRRRRHLNSWSAIYSVQSNDANLYDKTNEALRKVPYQPSLESFFDFHGQIQTFLQYLIRSIAVVVTRVRYNRNILVLPDGATIALDWAYMNDGTDKKALKDDSPILIMHHGLCGDSWSEHIVHTAELFMQWGYRVVVVVARGCGNLHLTSSESMLGSRTQDLREAVNYIRGKYPLVSLYCMGFSLGAAITLKYLAEEGKDAQVSASVCVSPPWDFTERTVVFPVWSIILAIPVKFYAWRHMDVLNEGLHHREKISMLRLMSCWSITECDELLVAGGRYGYQSTHEYWADCSPKHRVQDISVPTLTISATDDPVCCHNGCPSLAGGIRSGVARENSGLVVVKTSVGGHLAFPCLALFTSRIPGGDLVTEFSDCSFLLPPSCWADHVALHWFESFEVPRNSKT
jgi:predicted alpha/beta-fold hydrolase